MVTAPGVHVLSGTFPLHEEVWVMGANDWVSLSMKTWVPCVDDRLLHG